MSASTTCVYPGTKEPFYFPQGVLASPPRTESITMVDKDILKDRLNYQPHRSLNYTVSHTGVSPTAVFPCRRACRYIDPANRPGSIGTRAQGLGEPFYLPRKVFLEVFDALMVATCTASVSLDRYPCSVQRLGPLDLIDQAVPYASLHPLNEGLQHALRPHTTFHPVPIPGVGPVSPIWIALAGTAMGPLSPCAVFTPPPSCVPLLHGHYPASSLLWTL